VGSCFAAAFVVAVCQEHATAPLAPSPSVSDAKAAASPSTQSLVQTLWGTRSPLSLPSTVPSVEQVFTESGRQAIHPRDYVCSSSSPVGDFLDAELGKTLSIPAERTLFFELYDRSADLIPTYEALYYQTSATPQTFGYNGQFTQVMVNTERGVKGFWDIKSSDIQVVAMHGTVLLDTARTAKTYRLLGFSASVASANAKAVQAALLKSTTMNRGNYAFWTFNAFAFSTYGASVPDKIVMGDGILEAYAALGYGDVAPQAIFAHEFGHHIQYENGYFNDLPNRYQDPEQTRYTELMADAMSAYYLTHSRGAAMNQKRVEQFLDVFFQIGDCSFKSDGHHGTPNQRRAAATFGFKLAADAQRQGQILTSAQFHDLFVAQYPTLIAPDA
jgi:hypothetical protein